MEEEGGEKPAPDPQQVDPQVEQQEPMDHWRFIF